MIAMKNKDFLSRQLCFVFTFGARLKKAIKRGFIWIRPDGVQKICRDSRQLVSAIMNYDGRYLQRIVAQYYRLSVGGCHG